LRASLWVGLANLNESEMALFPECTAQCSSKELDTADIARDGDVTTTTLLRYRQLQGFH